MIIETTVRNITFQGVNKTKSLALSVPGCLSQRDQKLHGGI